MFVPLVAYDGGEENNNVEAKFQFGHLLCGHNWNNFQAHAFEDNEEIVS
jgi:hypothetical protein